MISSRLSSRRVLSALFLAAVAVSTLHCGGEDGGGGVTPPNDPAIALSSNTANFTSTAGGPDPAPQTIEITNGGEGTLDGLSTSISYTAGQATGWLTAVLSATEVPSTLILNVVSGSLAPATYTANVAITSSAATNSPQTLAVTLTVGPSTGAGAVIGLSSASQTFTGPAGGANPAAQTVEVTNGGGGTLDGLAAAATYTAGQPTGWLNATLSSATAPSTLTLTATTGSLVAGTYTATVAVTSAAASNSPQTVNVTFTVGSPSGGGTAAIKLSKTSESFTAEAGGADPGSETVRVTNSGEGTLSGLAAAVSYTAGQPTGWLAASLSSTTAPSTLTLAVTTGTLTAGTYTAGVAISGTGAGNSPQTVAVSFEVTAGTPSITITPSQVSFSAVQGGADPQAQTVAIANGGSGTLSGLTEGPIAYGSGASGWLSATLSGTTAPATLTLQATTGNLAAGSYTATVPVGSSGAGVGSKSVTVSFNVSSNTPATGILASSVVAAANGVINCPCNLYVVEVAPTGRDVLRGPIKSASGSDVLITDLALSPGGTLYGISFTTLYTIDQATGAATEVGPLGLNENANALAFDGSSTLYGATTAGTLFTVDVGTGHATEVGSYGNGVQSGGDIVFAPNGTLYGAAVTQDSKSVLVTIDPSSGAATIVDPTNSLGYDGIYGLAYFGGQLYGLSSDPTSATGLLLEINVNTGAAGFVRDLDFDSGGAGSARPPQRLR